MPSKDIHMYHRANQCMQSVFFLQIKNPLWNITNTKIPICNHEHQFYDQCLIHGGIWWILAADTQRLTNILEKESASEAQAAVGCKRVVSLLLPVIKENIFLGFMNMNIVPLTGIVSTWILGILCHLSKQSINRTSRQWNSIFTPFYIGNWLEWLRSPLLFSWFATCVTFMNAFSLCLYTFLGLTVLHKACVAKMSPAFTTVNRTNNLFQTF